MDANMDFKSLLRARKMVLWVRRLVSLLKNPYLIPMTFFRPLPKPAEIGHTHIHTHTLAHK